MQVHPWLKQTNKCTILVSDVGNEGGYEQVGTGDGWEVSVLQT